MLLANSEPSDVHRAFLAKKARDITAAILKVFWPSAKGSLHHACCALDYLLRSYADEVRRAIWSLKQQSHCLAASWYKFNLVCFVDWFKYSSWVPSQTQILLEA